MKPFVGLFALLAAVPAGAQFGPAQFGGVASGGATGNVRFTPLMQGNDLATNTPGLYVFNEPNAFASYWMANHRGPGPALQSDFFQRWRLLAIHVGNRPAGSSLSISNIVRRIDLATVNAIEIVPMARRGGRNDRTDRRPLPNVSPWVLLRVDRGAFDFALNARQVQGYVDAGYGNGQGGGGRVIKAGGATVYMP